MHIAARWTPVLIALGAHLGFGLAAPANAETGGAPGIPTSGTGSVVEADLRDHVWTPSRDGNGEISKASVGQLPLNEWVAVDGITAVQIERLHDAAGWTWNKKIHGNQRRAYSLLGPASYSGGALDTDMDVFWLPWMGGHRASSYNGVFGLDIRKMQWTLGQLPSDPDAPGLEWSENYRKIKGGITGYTTYTPVLPGELSDVLPDGKPTSRHQYRGVWYDPVKKTVNQSRRQHWEWHTPKSATPGEVNKHRWRGAKDGKLYDTQISHMLFYNEFSNTIVGTFNYGQSGYQRFARITPGNNDDEAWDFELISPGGMRTGGAPSGFRFGNKLCIINYAQKSPYVDQYAIFDLASNSWDKTATNTSGAPVPYGRAPWSSELGTACWVPQWGKAIRRYCNGAAKGNWYLFDPTTGAVESHEPKGAKPPCVSHPGNKMFYFEPWKTVIYIAPSSNTSPAVYVMRTGS